MKTKKTTFKNNFKELDSLEVDGEKYVVLESDYNYELPSFVRSDGELIEPKFNEEEDVLYWTLLVEAENDDWMDFYQKEIKVEEVA